MFAPERFRSLSDFLCKVDLAIKNKHPGVDVEFSGYVGWLQTMQRKFSSSSEQLATRHGGRHAVKYKMSTLIHSLRMSIECFGDSSIPALVNNALDIVCDPDVAFLQGPSGRQRQHLNETTESVNSFKEADDA